jgi:WD40 repeat protein
MSRTRPVARFAHTLVAALVLTSAAAAEEPPADSFWAQKESTSAVTFTPDGKHLVTAGGNLATGHIAVWNLETMTRTARFTDTGMVYALLLAPDGKTLFAFTTTHIAGRLTRSAVRILAADTGKVIAEIADAPLRGGLTVAMAVSPSGKRFAQGYGDGTVTLHDPANGKVTATLHTGKLAVWKLAFSPDDKTLAVGGSDPRGVQLWDVSKEKEVSVLPVGRYSVGALAFSPDGKTLIAGTGRDHDTPGELAVFDLATEKVKERWTGHFGPVVSVHFSRDGKVVASGARSSDIKLWDATTGKELLHLDGPLNLSRVAFSPDGKVLAVSGGTGDFIISSGGVRLWDLPSGRERLHPKAAAERDRRDRAVQRTHAEQARARAADERDTARATDRATDRARRSEYALAIHLAGAHIARWEFAQARKFLDELRPKPGQSDLRGIEWHLLEARLPRFTELGSREPAHQAALSPDGARAAVAVDDLVRVWNVTTGKVLYKVEGFRHVPGVMTFSPDGKLLAIADYSPNRNGSDVKIIAARTGNTLGSLTDHPDGVESLAFSPDGKKLASGGRGEHVVVWDTTTWKAVRAFERDAVIGKVAFSPDSKRLAYGGRFTHLRVHDLETGKELFKPGDAHGGLGDDGLVFLPDGKHLLAALRGQWSVVEVETGKVLRWLPGYGADEPVLCADGTELLAGWSRRDVSSGKELAAFEQSAVPGRPPRRGYKLLARTVGPDGTVRMVVADDDHTWCATFPLGDGRRELTIRTDSLSELGFSADSSNLLALTTRQLIQTKPDPDSNSVTIVGFASFVERWDATTGAVRFQPRWYDVPDPKLIFDPPGEPKVSAGRAFLQPTDLSAVRAWVRIPGAKDSVRVLGLSPDGRMLALYEGEEQGLTLRDARTGAVRARIPITDYWDLRVLFTSDGGLLTWKGDLVLWDAQTGAERKRWALPGLVRGVRLSPDGKEPVAVVLLAWRSPDVTLWDVRRGEPITVLRGIGGYIDTAVFSPDSQTLATSGDAVRVWDAVTGQPRGVLRTPGRLSYVAFRPDGRALAATGYQEPISLWAVPSAVEVKK